jgi:DNA-binding transcriptional regulator/RsmH inhibitor MraZ
VASQPDHNQATPVDMTTHTVDAVGRITLKQAQKDMLGEEAILTFGACTSMRMFSLDGYDRHKDNILELWDGNRLDPDWDQVQRQLLDSRVACKIDSQKRLRIPAAFLSRSGIEPGTQAEVQLVYRSQMGYWEIWPSDDIGKPEDPEDPFYQARKLLAERVRMASAQQGGGGDDD